MLEWQNLSLAESVKSVRDLLLFSDGSQTALVKVNYATKRLKFAKLVPSLKTSVKPVFLILTLGYQ